MGGKVKRVREKVKLGKEDWRGRSSNEDKEFNKRGKRRAKKREEMFRR